MIQTFLITALGGVIMSGVVGFVAHGKGKEAERLVWQTANVETLIGTNKNLSKILEKQDGEFFMAQKRDADAGQSIGTKTERVRTQIVEVPVTEYVEIEVPAQCDVTDVNINYRTIELLNSWSTGDSLEKGSGNTTTRDVPLVGSGKVSRDTAQNGYK